MKVKNIMFSGFAAAILMGVGAANAVVANPVTLADQGYVDAKVGQKENAANKFTDATKDAWRDATDKDVQFPTINVAEQIALDSVAQISADVADLTDIRNAANKATEDIAKLNGSAETEGSVANKIAAALKDAEGNAIYETAGAAAQALIDANAYTDQQVGALDTKVTNAAYVNAAGAVAAVEAAGYATTEDVSTAAAAAAATAVANSGHAEQTDLEAEVARATGAEAANKALIDANAADIKELQDANYTTMTAVEQRGYAVATEVADTYATKAEITEAGYATKTEAEGYATAAVDALNIEDYAKTANVNDELAKKLDKTAIDNAAGTYMVTSDGAGGFTYTQVKVATIDGEGNVTVNQ